VTEAPTTTLLEELRLQNLDAVIGRCGTAPLPGLTQEPLIRQDGCLLVHPAQSVAPQGARQACRSQRVLVAAAAGGNADARGDQRRLREGDAGTSGAAVEASSTKIIRLTLRANRAC
jgi:hypothetical protein